MISKTTDAPHWRARPVLGHGLHGLVLIAPIVLAIAAVAGVSRVLPRPPQGAGRIGWWLSLTVVSSVVVFGVERVTRRLLPLALLLRLSLVFPDRAPSRFLVAWRSGSSRQLAAWLRAARQQGRDDDATRAATRVLSLATALSAHDRRTRGHSERVRAFTDLLALAGELGWEETFRRLCFALVPGEEEGVARPVQLSLFSVSSALEE